MSGCKPGEHRAFGPIFVSCNRSWVAYFMFVWMRYCTFNIISYISDYILFRQAPDVYYKTLGNQLTINDLKTMARLTEALEELWIIKLFLLFLKNVSEAVFFCYFRPAYTWLMQIWNSGKSIVRLYGRRYRHVNNLGKWLTVLLVNHVLTSECIFVQKYIPSHWVCSKFQSRQNALTIIRT